MRTRPLIITLASLSVLLIPTQDSKVGHPASIGQLSGNSGQLLKPLPEPSVKPQALLASKITPPPSPVIQAPVASPAPTSDNAAKAFIYEHESGNSTTAVNPGGCRGLGQACPGTKLPCGADYACQDAWFTDYMQRTYGTWENAKAVWQSRCGSPQGCWW